MAEIQTLGSTPQQQPYPAPPSYEAMGEIEAQLQAAKRKQALAQALMQTGYIPNSGIAGVISSIFSAWKGGKLERQQDEKVSDALKRKFDTEHQATEYERAQDLQDKKDAEARQWAHSDAVLDRPQFVQRADGSGGWVTRPGAPRPPNAGMPANDVAPGTGPQMAAILTEANKRIAAGENPDAVEAWIAQQQNAKPVTETDSAAFDAANQRDMQGGGYQEVFGPTPKDHAPSAFEQQADLIGRTFGANSSEYRNYVAGKPAPKPIPPGALKLINDERGMVAAAQNIGTNIDGYLKQLDSGRLKLGPLENMNSKIKNYTGNSDAQSIAYGNLQAGLAKQRNDSLRLNKGTQTEGDAQRAWDEIAANTNDNKYVAERLRKIKEYNASAAAEHQQNVDFALDNYSRDPSSLPPVPKMANADAQDLVTRKDGSAGTGAWLVNGQPVGGAAPAAQGGWLVNGKPVQGAQ